MENTFLVSKCRAVLIENIVTSVTAEIYVMLLIGLLDIPSGIAVSHYSAGRHFRLIERRPKLNLKLLKISISKEKVRSVPLEQ